LETRAELVVLPTWKNTETTVWCAKNISFRDYAAEYLQLFKQKKKKRKFVPDCCCVAPLTHMCLQSFLRF